MDLQDVSLFLVAFGGIMGAIAILEAKRRARLPWRIVGLLVWLFIDCSIGQIIGRLYFGAARGVDFTRVFIYASFGLMLYILARMYQDYQQRGNPREKGGTTNG